MDRHILIESVSPCVDGGRYAAKSIAGESCVVEADIFRDGHAQIRAVIRWKRKGDQRFEEAPMLPIGNDRFRGEFPISE
jgi:starch synthase (maltosyl-transferring)